MWAPPARRPNAAWPTAPDAETDAPLNGNRPPAVLERGLQGLGAAYRRLHDTLLAERGHPFEGTPARSPQDIATYITHAAFHRLEGRPVPKALGRPGIARYAWFATRRSARRMAGRHVEGTGGRFFEEMTAQVPAALYTDAKNIIESGRVGPGPRAYAVFVAKAAMETGCFLFSGVTVDERPVFLTVFRKVAHGSLYKALWTGAGSPVIKGGRLGDHHHRGLVRIIRRYQLKIRDYPDTCIDFFGSITPKAALMAHSLFRHLRGREMARLQALPSNRYAALRRRVAAYSYPRFAPAQRIGPLEVLWAGTRRWTARMAAQGVRAVWNGRAHG